MKVDTEQLKQMVTALYRNLQRLETEMTVRGFVLHLLKESRVISPDIIDGMMRSARENPALQVINAKYDSLVNAVSTALDQASADEALLEFLQSWEPNGTPN